MTIIRISLLALLLFGTAAMAADDPYADPDWGYSFMDPHYLPTSAPAELEAFWNKFIPMLEANWSAESAYLRENSKELLSYARDVKGSLDDGTPYQKKFYNEAAADLVLQGDGLSAIPDAIVVARAARRRVLENFGLTILYNCIAVPLAVFGFVTPLVAAIAMSGSSMVVTLNALRLARK